MSATAIASRRPAGVPHLGRILLYLFVCLGAVIFMLPFFFALTSSLKTAQEIRIFPPTILPKVIQWVNYPALFELENLPYGIWYRNSIIITGLSMIGTVVSA